MNKLLFTLSLVVLVAVPVFLRIETIPESFYYDDNPIKIQKRCMFNITEALKRNTNCFTELMESIETELSKQIGNLTAVFHKYCHKRNSLYMCIHPLVKLLNSTNILPKDVLVGIGNRIVDFICIDEGKRINMFWLGGGIKCLNKEIGGLDDCAKRSFVKYDKSTGDILINVIDRVEQCQNINNLHHCSVNEMRKCASETSAKLVDEIFLIVLEETCIQNQRIIDTSSGTTQASILFIDFILMNLIAKILIV